MIDGRVGLYIKSSGVGGEYYNAYVPKIFLPIRRST